MQRVYARNNGKVCQVDNDAPLLLITAREEEAFERDEFMRSLSIVPFFNWNWAVLPFVTKGEVPLCLHYNG